MFRSSPFPPGLILAAFLLASKISALEISEILPEGGLQDADLDSPGWIELHNNSASPVNLGGWSLTDAASVLNKWVLPAQNLAPGARVIVFASGKNRAVANAELHANFRLDPDGEYLALVMPDGTTKASEFNPFPKLRRNVSYAIAPAAPVTIPILTDGAAVKWLVPTNGALGSAWHGAGFDDASWNQSATGLGFDATPVVVRADLKTPTSNGSIPAPAGWTPFTFPTVAESGTSTATTATATAGGFTVRLDAVGAGLVLASRNRQGGATDIIANTASLNNVAEDFVFASTSNYVAGTPKGMNVTISPVTPNTTFSVTLLAYDRGSPNTRAATWTDAVSGASGTLTFNGSNGQLADECARGILARGWGLHHSNLGNTARSATSLRESPRGDAVTCPLGTRSDLPPTCLTLLAEFPSFQRNFSCEWVFC